MEDALGDLVRWAALPSLTSIKSPLLRVLCRSQMLVAGRWRGLLRLARPCTTYSSPSPAAPLTWLCWPGKLGAASCSILYWGRPAPHSNTSPASIDRRPAKHSQPWQ